MRDSPLCRRLLSECRCRRRSIGFARSCLSLCSLSLAFAIGLKLKGARLNRTSFTCHRSALFSEKPGSVQYRTPYLGQIRNNRLSVGVLVLLGSIAYLFCPPHIEANCQSLPGADRVARRPPAILERGSPILRSLTLTLLPE